MKGTRTSVGVGCLLLMAMTGGGPGSCVENQRMVPSRASGGDLCGQAIAMDERFAVCGAPGARGRVEAQGAADVFEWQGGEWVERERLIVDGFAGDGFGTAVALSGSWLAVGAPSATVAGPGSEARGRVWLFERQGGAWVERQRLESPTPSGGDSFGFALAFTSDGLAVGSPGEDPSGTSAAGSVEIFRRAGGVFHHDATLVSTDLDGNGRFGQALSAAGDRLIVGEPGDDERGMLAGAASVFHLAGGSWRFEFKLLAPGGVAFDQFGAAVALSEQHALVGAPLREGGAGAAFVFRFENGPWSFEQEFSLSSGEPGDQYGRRVAIDEDQLMITAPFFDERGAMTGKGEQYRYDGSTWVGQNVRTTLSPESGEWLGEGLAMNRRSSLLGAPRATEDGEDTGALYRYDRSDLSLYSLSTGLEAGDTLRLLYLGGLAGGWAMLYVTEAQGSPTFTRIHSARFELGGTAELAATIPPGLGGLELQMHLYGHVQPGRVGVSNSLRMTFQ